MKERQRVSSIGNHGGVYGAALCLGFCALMMASSIVTTAVAAAPEKVEGDPPALKVPFPKGYRDWPHVKTELIHDARHPLFQAMGGMHHIYANPAAAKALRGNRKFPTGAVLVLDLLDYKDQQGAFVELGRKFVGVMVRDEKKYKATNGWGWQAWDGGNADRPVLKGLIEQKACASCHTQAVNRGFTFSDWAK